MPDVAACERCALPHVAAHERYAALHAVPGGLYAALHVVPRGQCAARRAVVHAVSYRVLPEPLVLQWSVPERLVLERRVMAVSEPQHLTLLARWSAGPTQRLSPRSENAPRREISCSLMLETSKKFPPQQP